MQIVIVGHVDHGKSTVIGRLLADTGSLPDGKLERIRAHCARHSKPFEYAFLLDALEHEQAQGITIDVTRVFFRSARREYLVLDAPGHIEFLKNMVTGAAHAEAALLVVDAHEGVCENSRRHGYLLSMLGIRQVGVVVSKMDLVDYDESTFRRIAAEYGAFLESVDIKPAITIPASGLQGDNITESSARLAWFDGPSVLEAIDGFEEEPRAPELPFRMPVQDVYKFTRDGDNRRIVAGTVESGTLRVGDEVLFFPSGKRSRVRTLESFERAPPDAVRAGEATGFTLDEQIYISRGAVATRADQPSPQIGSRFVASVFWLGKRALAPGREYLLRIGTARVAMQCDEVRRVVDASTLDQDTEKTEVARHDVAEVVLHTARPISIDLAADLASAGRFVIVEDYDIVGGGIVREVLHDGHQALQEQVFQRNYRWEKSFVSSGDRAQRFGQGPAVLLITAESREARKTIAKALEERLFADGRLVYYLGFGSILHGLDADIERAAAADQNTELMRRLGEIAHILMDAGLILLVSLETATDEELGVLRTVVGPDVLHVVWVGQDQKSVLPRGLSVKPDPIGDGVEQIVAYLREQEVIAT